MAATIIQSMRQVRQTAFGRLPVFGMPAARARPILVPDVARRIEVKMASTRSEWEQAYQLVADSYQLRGRTLQRAWLVLTANGLAAQPMMSALVLRNLAETGSSPALDEVGAEAIASLERELPDLLPEIGGGRLAFVLRFGHASAPSGRTGRLPWQDRTLCVDNASPVAGIPHVH